MSKNYYLPKVYLKNKRSLNSVSPADRTLAITPGEYRKDIEIVTDNTDSISDTNGNDTNYLPQIYDAGDQCWVMASEDTVVCDRGLGIVTVSIPAGVILYSLKSTGSTTELSSNKFTIRFNFEDVTHNQDIDSFFPPIVQVMNITSSIAGGPSSVLPFVYDEGTTPQVQLTRLDSGILDITVINLNQFSNWTILCVF
jgi:hypothetical protein